MGERREVAVARVVNVLKTTADMAREAAMIDSSSASRPFLVRQYNRIYGKLIEKVPEMSELFEELAADSPLDVVAMASYQLAAFLEPELKAGQDGRVYETVLDMGPFRIVVGRDFDDVRELARLLREAAGRGAEPA